MFTAGGNDMFAFAQDLLEGGTVAQVDAEVDATIARFETAMAEIVAARPRFPNGLFVVFGNLYEYTDGTGDLSVCPNAELLGFDGVISEMRANYVRVNEAWVRIAVGIALIVFGIFRWLTRHNKPHAMPGTKHITEAGPGKALAVGAVLTVANPKVLFICLAAGLAIGTSGIGVRMWWTEAVSIPRVHRR